MNTEFEDWLKFLNERFDTCKITLEQWPGVGWRASIRSDECFVQSAAQSTPTLAVDDLRKYIKDSVKRNVLRPSTG